jgi:SAM-dependent methyltransferase
MSPRSCEAAEFDAYADDYRAALHRGLRYSGEDAGHFASERVKWVARLLEELHFTPRTLLDFGCGTGASTPHFLSHLNVQVTGIDVSRGLLERARLDHGSPQTTYLLQSDYQPRGQADIAFCNGVFHHIKPTERRSALDYVWRSVRQGGLFAFWENNPWNPGTRFVMSRIPFDRDAITIRPSEARRLLRDAGFEVVRTDHLFFFPRMLRLLRPLERHMTGVPLGAQYLVLALKA